MSQPLARWSPIALFSLLSAALCDASLAQDARGQSPEPRPSPVEVIVERYLESWFETFPIRSTSAGRHDRDGELDRLDRESRAAWVAVNRRTGAALDALLADPERLSFDDREDAKLLRRRIERVLFDWVDQREPERNPLFWSGRMANAVVFLTVREDRPANERLAAASARARQMPRLVAAARSALGTRPEEIPPEWLAAATAQTRRAADFYADGLARVAAAQAPALEDEARRAGITATGALTYFANYLDSLSDVANGSVRLGTQAYAHKLALFSDRSTPPAQVLARAEAALVAKREETAAYGRSVWPQLMEGVPPADDIEVVRALFRRVGDDHASTVEEFVDDFIGLLEESEQWVRERELITLPDPLTVATRRSPDYFAGQGVGGVYAAGPYAPDADTLFYLPTPPPQLSDAQREAFFRDFNDHFNRMITPHEMIPGHYLQLKIAAQQERKVRALFGDGVYVEGWGTFSERLMLDEGWGDPLDRLAHLKKQIENIARTIIDIRVHTSDVTRDEAVKFVQEQALQEAHFAGNMWNRAITTSPQLTSYWLGYEQHQALFREVREAFGERFVLREYLDAVVAHGGLPVSAYRELLLGPLVPPSGTQ
ncbi:MAG: DUF885 family protein [Pseudomonadota bacterium]